MTARFRRPTEELIIERFRQELVGEFAFAFPSRLITARRKTESASCRDLNG